MDRAATLKTDPLIRRFLRLYLPRIRKAVAPQEVWVFGSRVRGDALEGSDLDVVVVARAFGAQDWPDRAAAILRDADVTHNIEFLCYTPEEFARKRKELGIVNAAVEEGVRVA
jgi:predicted nucleotidyltransferase